MDSFPIKHKKKTLNMLVRRSNRRVTEQRDNQGLSERVQQLVAAPDKGMKSYKAVAGCFERLARQKGWTNTDGSIYPVSLANLQHYIALQEKRVKPQSLKSYLSALREKHEQLGFLDWTNVRFHSSIIRMMKNVKRNHVHTQAKRSQPITGQNLAELRAKLDGNNPRHALFWAIATVAFHAMARLGEILPIDQSRTDFAIRLRHLTLEKGENGPYATITLPTSKTHDPNIEATLSVWEDGSDTCPLEALQAFLKVRLHPKYAKNSDFLWCIETGEVVGKQWFLDGLASFLPECDLTGHSFRAGGATHLALRGYPKWIIQRLGRWSSDAFEIYIRTRPVLLIAFAQAADLQRTGCPAGMVWKGPAGARASPREGPMAQQHV